MGEFLLLFFICLFLIVKKSNYEILTNPFFWIGIFWILIIGIYLTSGINYKYGMSVWTFIFLIVCTLSLFLGNKKSKYSRIYVFKNETPRCPIGRYCFIGIVGVLLFTYDYIRLNGLATSKQASDISIIGSIGSLFVPILLVLGLYLNAKRIKENGKFNILGIVLIFGYSIPCMVNAGREAILFCIIGLLCLFGYLKRLEKRTGYVFNSKSLKSVLLVTFLGSALIFLGFLMMEITSSRYTENEINVLLNKRDISSSAIESASKWGNFQFLYYNIASYFSHQIPFLDFTLQEYEGPYLLGLYELNIISRRLPESLGLDYRLVSGELSRLFSKKTESFEGSWNTVLGSLIIDFTWVGAIVICYWCGYIIGIVKRKMQLTLDPRYATLLALFCLSSFSTIQLGPFFQIQIYGTYVWWYILFRKGVTVRVSFLNRS